MSRIGNRKLEIPAGVKVEVEDKVVKVTGPKGELTTALVNGINVKIEDNVVEVVRENDRFKAIHGTLNSLIKNMIEGVTQGYEKRLEIVGVGYRFNQKGNALSINAGFSKPVEIEVPQGIKVELPSNTELVITGINKEIVGEFAANVRKIRKPEPYKGKGIRYKDERIIRKEGKKAA